MVPNEQAGDSLPIKLSCQIDTMAAGQLWLFDPPKPLVERLGEEFFTALPTGPGVYLMCGAQEGVLYVGKARNLRKRLSSYRVANPERMPRRTIRLLHQVRRIEWDECASEQLASEREEMLICVLAPKFNSAGKVREIRRTHESLTATEVALLATTFRGKSKTQLVAAAAQFIVKSACVTSKT
jgi:hypothetical protein